MQFNSLDFAIFLPVVFAVYWFATGRNIRLQNLWIVAASYFFYGSWDPRFLALIFISTVVDFVIGKELERDSSQSEFRRKALLWISIAVNLGFLGFFKYCNFFIDSFSGAFSFFGVSIGSELLNIILPVGISFYTFQTMSYTIDVYRKKIKPTHDFVAFAAFVSFFPQLVAGPIERATNLLPQFHSERHFNYDDATDGMRQILWGLFKKVVIADNCATLANTIFDGSGEYSGSTLLLGAVFFAFQIYGDFSGYSDIAIGTSRLLGFRLMQNFAFPYFSRDIAEFWRRWHISLSTWFRDYLYIPLGGSRGTTGMRIRNTFIVFLVSGFWHGANWTFVVWGFLHAMYFLPLLLLNQNRVNTDLVAEGKLLPSIKDLIKMVTTFTLVTVAWVFFRADSVPMAFRFLKDMIFTTQLFALPKVYSTELLILLAGFIVVEWLGRSCQFALQNVSSLPKWARWGIYFVLITLMFIFTGEEQEFIYFQF